MAGSDEDERLGQLEALLLESFGLHLLSFLCGVDQDEMLARLNGKLALPVAAESVLTADLAAIAQHVAAQVASQPTLPKRFSLDVLARPVGRNDESLGALLRLSARGGLPDELPPHPAGDAIKVALRRLSVDVFPLLLAPEDPHWRMPLVSMYQHPVRQALQAAVQEDPRLRQLFTADDPGLGRSGYIYTSLGRGGSIQDVMFGELVIGSAWDSLTMTQDSPSLSDLIQQVEANVDALRSVAAGGQKAVAARLVFTGFTTSQSRSIVTPWGVVRRIHDWERRLAPPWARGCSVRHRFRWQAHDCVVRGRDGSGDDGALRDPNRTPG